MGVERAGQPRPAPETVLAGTSPKAGEVTPAMRLQILSTEHWSLLASRNLAWNETFSRTGIYLTALSGAIVALALVAQATQFGEEFRLFGLVVLPVVLFVGIGTFLRLDSASYHDVICVIGMNRIRAAYLEMAPDLERFFVMGATDDMPGLQATFAVPPNRSMVSSVLAATPWLVGVLNALLAAAIITLLAIQLGADTWPAIGIAVAAFLVAMGLTSWWARRELSRLISEHRPMFPAAGHTPSAE